MAQKKRILIVHHDQDVHDILNVAIIADDLEPETTFDENRGLELAQTGRFDVILTGFPEMTPELRRLCPHTRVVVLTGQSTPEKIVAGIRSHVFGWFSVPFKSASVRETVDHALEHHPADDEIEVVSASPAWLELQVHCKMSTAGRVLHFVKELDSDMPESTRDGVSTAFREILMNAIEHGAGNDPTKTMTVKYIRSEGVRMYSVADPGVGFSLNELPHAAVSNPLENPIDHVERRSQLGLRSGGFGILMTRSLVDEMIYNEAGNEVLLIKYLR